MMGSSLSSPEVLPAYREHSDECWSHRVRTIPIPGLDMPESIRVSGRYETRANILCSEYRQLLRGANRPLRFRKHEVSRQRVPCSMWMTLWASTDVYFLIALAESSWKKSANTCFIMSGILDSLRFLIWRYPQSCVWNC